MVRQARLRWKNHVNGGGRGANTFGTVSTSCSHHHLVAELVVEGVGEEARDGGEAVHYVERQAAVVAQHHQQGAHVSVDLVHLDGRSLQELQTQNAF